MGKSQVITYIDPLRLTDNPDFQSVRDWVHICATPSLKLGMQERYGDSIGYQVATSELIPHLLRPWMSDGVRLRQYARLTRYIADLQAQHPDWAPVLRAFRRNQREVLLGIRLFTEAGVDASQIRPQKLEERIFQKLWERMEQEDPSLKEVRRLLHQTFQEPGRFQEALEKALNEAEKEAARKYKRKPRPHISHNGRLVFHGFYFITPLQHLLIKLCEQADMEVVFLNCYDPRYPRLFQTWEAFFDPNNGLPGKAEWRFPTAAPGPESWGAVLATFFDGGDPAAVAPANPLTIHRFEDIGSFLAYFDTALQRSQEPEAFYSPEASTLDRFLREYYPEKYQDRHFLAYPVGQLIFHLHQMWDEQDQTLKLTERHIYESFASGWLQAGPYNGKDYTRELHDLLPFFAGCETLPQWRERAEQLKAIRRQVVARFDTTLPQDRPNHRFHQYLSNPLERLAYFRVGVEAIDAIVALMERLFTLAETLFAGQKEVALAEHLKRIEDLLLAGADWGELMAEEKRLLEGLRDRVAREIEAGSDEDRFLPQDLAEAIMLFLGGDLTKDDPTADQEREYLVGPLDRLDGAVLKAEGDHLHLCLLSETSLPKRKGAFPWPLSAQSFAPGPADWAVRMLQLREEQSANADRYLLYNTLAWAGQVTLSYVVSWQDQILGPSPYLRLLAAHPNAQQADRPHQPWQPDQTAPVEPIKPPPYPDLHPNRFERLPADALAEAALCPRRFYYSFLAQESPTYRSDFHHRFLYGSLARAFALTTGLPLDRVVAELDKLFPQWSPLLRQALLEQSPEATGGYDRYDGAEYPRARYRIHLLAPGQEVMAPAMAVLDQPADQQQQLQRLADALARAAQELSPAAAHPLPVGVDVQLPPVAPEAFKLCRFCPHQEYCAAAHYAVDDDQRGDAS